jgi:signal transduction histidine kinase
MPDDVEPGGQSSPPITADRVQLEQQKRASLSLMARGMAHDFNNFLMVILGQAELGQLTAPADSPAQAQFNQILTATHRAAELCRQLMAYAGQARLSLATIDLAPVLNDLAAELQPSLGPSSVLRCEWAEPLPPVSADKAQLQMAIRSAIRNACESLPPDGGIVTLRAGSITANRTYQEQIRPATQLPPGPYAFVEIVDNGCGMTEETLALAFDPFFSTKRAHSGIGLSTLLGIVRSHRGAVHLESAAGQGATVRILLPVAVDSQGLAARLRPFLAD